MDIIIIAIILIIVSLAVCYIYKSREKGNKCIGCPNANICSGNCTDKF